MVLRREFVSSGLALSCKLLGTSILFSLLFFGGERRKEKKEVELFWGGVLEKFSSVLCSDFEQSSGEEEDVCGVVKSERERGVKDSGSFLQLEKHKTTLTQFKK